MVAKSPPLDFAISYAGEDVQVAGELAERLRELGFEVFFAAELRHLLAGRNGEELFEALFVESKVVVAFISAHYKNKDWARFEWDVIRDRASSPRFIAVRLDDTRILGLSSNLSYVPFTGDNYDDIVKACVSSILIFEQETGMSRASEYDRVLESIRSNNKGALAEAFQLFKDARKRDPLADIEIPDVLVRRYEILSETWNNFGVVRRRSVKTAVPRGLSREELRLNLKHCAATQFNAFKPDAIMVYAYEEGSAIEGPYTAGRAIFAPLGEWGKAQDGVAYNLPVQEFEFTIDLAPGYFRS
jgi:hypothetical protein